MGQERIAAVDDLVLNTGREFVIGDRVVALFRTDLGFFAIDGMCAHAGGPLAKGTLHGQIVTCPWHGWQYDVSTGRHCLNPGICQQSFPVTIQAGEVYVDIP